MRKPQQKIEPPDRSAGPPLVPLHCMVFLADVPAVLRAAGVTVDELVARHRRGDWGFVDDEFEAQRLDEAAARGEPVTSHYMIWPGGKARSVYVTTQGQETHIRLVPKSLPGDKKFFATEFP